MTKQDFLSIAAEVMKDYTPAQLPQELQVLLDAKEFSFFDTPLIGFAGADDPLFEKLKEPQAVGEHFITPAQWLEGAVSVVSIFIPYSEGVKKANAAYPKDEIAPHYIHAKNYTQPFAEALVEKLSLAIKAQGYSVVVPSKESARMKAAVTAPDGSRLQYTSGWSERHIAYICGLGSFGIHKAIITQKGALGRFISLVTDMPLEPDHRQYSEIYQYCTLCGACGRKCPGDAITTENGKNKVKCSAFLDTTKEKYAPLYGCAKCMCGVPCANGRPNER